MLIQIRAWLPLYFFVVFSRGDVLVSRAFPVAWWGGVLSGLNFDMG